MHLFECTAEHKIACQDGGKDTRANIVAACWHCNHQRHANQPAKALDSLSYAVFVAFAVLEQTWPTFVATGGDGDVRRCGAG
ncbi:HNH endonuclease [Variovorax soli]|uniref:5-methylcytosine-specific restriction endonuclease McrA n=1 Tax=Variovorax soli TaxID=376815 RepID=A0ABU1NC31_9BURK|nr:HNH endonuclease [Variovorax soli]MDR6535601.1 5-methylcytosine-specific restriction endonuclease McrA [Variovorax soli]